ncbi:MAG: zinc-binding dehydrogenase [Polyangiales bacterium]
MKAYVLTDQGPRLTDHPEPTPRPTELRVRVRAAALNRVDLAMLHGHVHGGAGGRGAVLGVEFAGEVDAVGADVRDVKVGQRVMCSGAGGFAEYAVVDAARVLAVPETLDFTEAATLPVALQTMHDAIVSNGLLTPGQTVLVQGASSGVGLMALQIAKLRGARWVAGSSTDPERRTKLGAFGADLAFDSRDPAWVEQVLAGTDGQGVDLVIDQVSGALFNATLRATRVQGRIVNVGRLGGNSGEIDFDLHAMRRIQYVGVTFRTRSRDELRAITRRVRDDLSEAVAQKQLALPVDRVYPLAEIVPALEHMRQNRHFGKIVVAV